MLKSIILLCSLQTIYYISASKPYCDRNETIISHTPVVKTRQVIVKPSVWKFWKKSQTKTVEYTDSVQHVQHKLVSVCCEGYNMTELKICEPICIQACPSFSSCVEPNRCQCMQGYISSISHENGRPYCEPICNQTCPIGTVCTMPNKCECRNGYRALDDDSGQCVPKCENGDGCQNGKCVDVNECICNKGYAMDKQTKVCIPANNEYNVEEPLYEITNSEETTTDLSFTINSSEEQLSGTVTECSKGFLLYKGTCHAERFMSTDIDCRYSECGENQICLANGSCTCKEGYTAHKNTSANQIESLNNFLLCKLIAGKTFAEADIDADANANVEMNMNKLKNFDPKETYSLTATVGAIIMFFAVLALLIAIIAMFVVRRRSYFNIADKMNENLQCAYANKTYDTNECVP